MKLFAPIVFGLLTALTAGGCQEEGGVSTGVLRVDVLEEAAPERGSVIAADACTRFPVLRGARRDLRYQIDGFLSINLQLTRNDVTIRFEGTASSNAASTLSRDDVRQGVTLSVTSPSGRRLLVVLTASCDAPSLLDGGT